MRIALTLILSFSICACATVPSNAPNYRRAANPGPGLANVYIYRIGAYPTLRTPKVTIDGSRIFDPPEKSYTVVTLPGGLHEMKIDWAWDTGWPDLDFPISVVAGQSLYIKISGSFRGTGRGFQAGSYAKEVPQATADYELANCCRLIAPSGTH
jgi:hypothetical protein